MGIKTTSQVQPFGLAKDGWQKKDPNSCAILSSSGAAPGPKEERFETAQALEKRLSLRAHRESS
jgi:hypothetical protein